MPILELTESDLEAYLDKLPIHPLFSTESLRELSLLYSRFQLNEQNLINFEYTIERIHLENNYLDEKKRCQSALEDLKIQFKQIDNRIISVEQKLSRGIPEDLELIDKLITEQEAIVQDQENINAEESALKEQITNIDIKYGTTGEKLRQNRLARQTPIKSRFEQYAMMINKADQKTRWMTTIFGLVLIIGIPLLLEFIAISVKIPIIASDKIYHSIPAHYLFFGSLILTELFLAERIRNKIYAFFAIRYTKKSLDELAKLLSANLGSIANLEKKTGIKLQVINDTNSHFGLR